LPLRLALLGLLILASRPAHAATSAWTGASTLTPNFSDATNWSGTDTPPVSNDSITFGVAGTSGTNLVDNLTTPASFNLAGITFNAGGSGFVINPGAVGTNGFTLTGPVTNSGTALQTINDLITLSSAQTITTNTGGGNILLGGNIGGTGSFTTAGTGILALSGNNAFSGGITIASGATLQLQANAGNTTSGNSTVMPTQNFTNSQLNNLSTIQLRADSSVASGGIVTFDSGATAFGVNGFGARLSGTYSFDVNNISSGTGQILQLGSPTGTTWTVGSGAQGTAFFMNVSGGNGYTLQAGNFQVGNNYSLTFNPTTANLIIAGINNSTPSTGSVTKIGAGALIVTGSVTSTGGIIISSGTLQLGNASTSGSLTTASSISDSGVFSVNRTNTTIQGTDFGNTITGAGAFNQAGTGTTIMTASNAYTGATTISSGTLQLGNAGATGALSNLSAITNNGNLAFNRTNTAVQGTDFSKIITGSGILTQAGTGILQLTGSNTYQGATNITAGTLQLTGTGSINTSSQVNINGAGAKFLQTSTAAGTNAVHLTQGTLDGTGSLGAVTIASAAGNVLTHGNGSAATFTLGSLTFSGAATVNLVESNLFTGAPIKVTGVLSTSGAGTGEIVINGTGSWANGLDTVISYGSLGVGGIADFSKGTISGLSGRQSAGSLVNTGSSIALNINGDSLVWTGTATSNSPAWITAATNSVTSGSSWVLKAGHTTSDYWAGDIVEFDDTANFNGSSVIPSTAVNITGSNVTPASVTFNNNALAYTISSSDSHGIVGATTITMTGTGSLTLSESNTYTGPTSVNNGTLHLVGGSLNGTAITVGTGGTFTENATSTITGIGSLTTSGAATLSGSNGYTGPTTVNAGVLNLTNGGVINNSAITLSSTAAFNEDSASSIGGVASLTTSGTATLSGSNSYSGATAVSGGLLTLNGTLNGSPVSVGAASTFTENSTGAISGSTASLSVTGTASLSGNNSYAGATTLNTGGLLTLNGTLSASSITVAGTSTLSEGSTGAILGATSTLVNTGTTILSGVNTFGGQTTNNGYLQLNGTASLSPNSILRANTTGAVAAFRADTSGTFTTAQFSPAGAPVVSDFDVNQLTAGNTGNTITLVSTAGSAVGGNGIMVLDVTGGNGYNFVLVDNATLTGNAGAGWELIPTTANFTMAGNMAGGGATGQVFDLDGTASNNFITGVISNTVGVTKSNTSTWTLSNVDTYSGPTIVTGGNLIVSGSLSATASAALSGGNLEADGLVNQSATITLTGSGQLSGVGSVGPIIGNGGTLAPGRTLANATSAPGVLSVSGAVTLSSTTNFSIRLGVASPTDSDTLQMLSGNVNLAGANLVLTLGGAYVAPALGTDYVIINGTPAGSIFTNQFAQGTSITDSNGDVFNIFYQVNANDTGFGNDVILQLATQGIPEPGTYAMVIAGIALLGFRQKFRARGKAS